MKKLNKDGVLPIGSAFNNLLAALKEATTGSEEETTILEEMSEFLLSNPEIIHTSWVDIPSYLKEYIPLIIAFALVLNFIDSQNQSEIALSIASKTLQSAGLTELKNESTKALHGRDRLVCANFMAIPGIPE